MTQDQIQQLMDRIQELSEEGLNLAGIERVLGLETRLERAERRIRDLADELSETMERHREELAAAHAARGQMVVPHGSSPRRPRSRAPPARAAGRDRR